LNAVGFIIDNQSSKDSKKNFWNVLHIIPTSDNGQCLT
jgi:hypothetical protein